MSVSSATRASFLVLESRELVFPFYSVNLGYQLISVSLPKASIQLEAAGPGYL